MEISCRRLERLTILDLRGRCAVSSQETEVEPLRALVARLVAEGRVHVAVNLAALKSVDARGLGELVFTHQTLGAAGGELAIVAPNSAVRRMLSVTRLDKVLRLFESETETAAAVLEPHQIAISRDSGDVQEAPGRFWGGQGDKSTWARLYLERSI